MAIDSLPNRLGSPYSYLYHGLECWLSLQRYDISRNTPHDSCFNVIIPIASRSASSCISCQVVVAKDRIREDYQFTNRECPQSPSDRHMLMYASMLTETYCRTPMIVERDDIHLSRIGNEKFH
jgi:hypothetical protein